MGYERKIRIRVDTVFGLSKRSTELSLDMMGKTLGEKMRLLLLFCFCGFFVLGRLFV